MDGVVFKHNFVISTPLANLTFLSMVYRFSGDYLEPNEKHYKRNCHPFHYNFSHRSHPSGSYVHSEHSRVKILF